MFQCQVLSIFISDYELPSRIIVTGTARHLVLKSDNVFFERALVIIISVVINLSQCSYPSADFYLFALRTS
jgi:hypothetical protein